MPGLGAQAADDGRSAGRIGLTYRESAPSWPPRTKAVGKPNMIVVVLDDKGFGSLGVNVLDLLGLASTAYTPPADSAHPARTDVTTSNEPVKDPCQQPSLPR